VVDRRRGPFLSTLPQGFLSTPNQDQLQEMKFQTNAYAAENGAAQRVKQSSPARHTSVSWRPLRLPEERRLRRPNDYSQQGNSLASGQIRIGDLALRDNIYGGQSEDRYGGIKLFFSCSTSVIRVNKSRFAAGPYRRLRFKMATFGRSAQGDKIYDPREGTTNNPV